MSKAGLKRRLEKLERAEKWTGRAAFFLLPPHRDEDLEREIARRQDAGDLVVVWGWPDGEEWTPERQEELQQGFWGGASECLSAAVVGLEGADLAVPGHIPHPQEIGAIR
jgi:hypothetical protein